MISPSATLSGKLVQLINYSSVVKISPVQNLEDLVSWELCCKKNWGSCPYLVDPEACLSWLIYWAWSKLSLLSGCWSLLVMVDILSLVKVVPTFWMLKPACHGWYIEPGQSCPYFLVAEACLSWLIYWAWSKLSLLSGCWSLLVMVDILSLVKAVPTFWILKLACHCWYVEPGQSCLYFWILKPACNCWYIEPVDINNHIANHQVKCNSLS